MKLRAFDCHTHRLTGDRRQGDSRVADGARLFGSGGGADDQIELYRDLGLLGVVFDVDSETTTGQRIDNDEIAAHVAASDGQLLGFASVDPWKGAAAIAEIERCHAAGFRGVKFQPITQGFFVDDRRFAPMWAACSDLELPVLIHTGTTAIGNDSPGGRGLKLKYGQPIPHLDDLAADHPGLTIIAAHPGWPWHLDLLAVARHKGNVFIDLSGWAPKYFPPEVIQHFNSVMPHKFLFGSDYPLMPPGRWLREFDGLPLKPTSRQAVLFENACRIFDLSVDRFEDPGPGSFDEGAR